jgi:Flp pilus assembly pilin Flp
MKTQLTKIWHEQDGVLSFEWAMLLTLLVIGVIGGMAAARDAIVDEFGDASQAMLALDGSFTIAFPLHLTIDGVSTGMASDSSYTDEAAFADCGRAGAANAQGPELDNES